MPVASAAEPCRSPDAATLLPEGLAPPDGIPEDVFAAAYAVFADGDRVELGALGERLGVARSTISRAVHGREALLAALGWRATRGVVLAALPAAPPGGRRRVLDFAAGFAAGAQADPGLRAFLEREPARALRVLTGTESPVHRGLCSFVGRLLGAEGAPLVMDVPRTSACVVRLLDGVHVAAVARLPLEPAQIVDGVDALFRAATLRNA